MNKLKILLVGATLCYGVMPMGAAAKDTARVEHLSIWNMLTKEQRTNPALHGSAYHTSYSEMALNYDYQKQSEAFVQEKGDGSSLGSLAIESYLRMNVRTAVWGSASYTAGTQKNIRWNSSSDYDLLQPYLMADAQGGDTHKERYTFSGGYATQLGRWSLGGELAIRAEHEYRDRDPRMRGIVTDVSLGAGAAYDACNYRWAATVRGSIYKQTNSVDFYNELGVIPEYHMLGLGAEYARFSGEHANVSYRGGGIGVQLDALPLTNQGVYAHVAMDRSGYERLLASDNSLPLSKLIYNKVSATIGWKQDGKQQWAVYGNFAFQKRSGDENIVGKSDSQYYPVLGKLTMYKDYLMDASLGAMYGRTSAKQHWMLSLKAGVRNHRERYVYPERKLNRAHAYAALEGQWMRTLTERFALSLNLGVQHYAKVSDDLVMPFANMEEDFAAMMRQRYLFAKASYTDAQLKVRGDYSLRNLPIGLFAEINGGVVVCSESEHQLGMKVTLGVTF